MASSTRAEGRGNAEFLVAAAVALVGCGLLAGCPGEVSAQRRGRWEKYYSLDAAGHVPAVSPQNRASAESRRSWDIPAEVTPRRWKYIVIHHSATDEGSAELFDLYHREVKGWKGLAYHFVIGNGTRTPDGAVEVGYRWKRQTPGAHTGVRDYNYHGIGVCLVGDFEHSLPTKRQMAKLRELLVFLAKRFGVGPDHVVRHCDVSETKCPGKNFPWPVPGLDSRPIRQPEGSLREKARKRLELD